MVLDETDAVATAAVVVAVRDLEQAAKLLDRASSMRRGGPGQASGLPSREESIAEWERMHGGSMSDPAVREKIYKAIAAERKMELEAAERAARDRAAASAGSAKLRRRRHRG